ncbi:MAG: response regulator [Gammaproteobacteria bacterium]|nr:response regulator [Gammaproteobacteria bacterium]NIV75791.1 response regulator [Gammaproteobacteria bacterium]
MDDQPHIVRVIRLALEGRGYTVQTASNGEQALSKLREERFHVVITDIEMPRLDGRALCEAMHREFPGPQPLTLVITARPELAAREWVHFLPNTELLEKPLSLRRLNARLDEHFATGPVKGAPCA